MKRERIVVTWRAVALVAGVVVAIAAVFTAATLATARQDRVIATKPGEPTPPEGEERDPTSAELKLYLDDAASRIYYYLRIAAGEKPDCLECDTDFARVTEQLRDVCHKVSPQEALTRPSFDEKVHEPVTTALVR